MTANNGFSSKRISALKGSAIRDILAVASGSDIISFAGGIPDPNLFDLENFAASFEEAFRVFGRRVMQYATTKGEPELREQAAIRLSKVLPTTPDQVQITCGSQESIYLACCALLDQGDIALVEEPTYLAAIQAIRSIGANPVGVTSDSEGVVPEALEAAIKLHSPKMLYLIPNFQNPSGRSMSLKRREAVAQVLLRHQVMLVEDDPYGELRFSGVYAPPMSALPGMEGRSLLLNSLSKILAPGVRIGWTRGTGEIMRHIEVTKQAVSLQSAVTDQLAVACYLANYPLDEKISKISAAYKTKCDVMAETLGKLIPQAKFNKPEGGMFFWLKLLDGTNTQELFKRAIENKVAFVPGESFFAENPDPSCMRLSYVTNDEATIIEGVRRLAKSLHAV